MRRTLLCGLFLLASCNSSRLASAPPGSYLVVLDKSDATLRMIEPNSGHVRDLVPTGIGPHEAVAAPDGTLVVVSDYGDQATLGHTLTVFDPFARHVVATIDLSPHTRPHGIAFLDQRSTVLVTSETSKALLVVDLGARKVTRIIPTEAELSHMLAVTPDRTRVFTANMRGNSVSAIDLSSGKVLEVLETGNQPEAIAVTPDGNEVWIGHNGDDKIVVLDAHTLEKKAEFACGKKPIRIAFVPNGELALVSCADSDELALIDAHARTERKRIALFAEPVPPGHKPGNPLPPSLPIGVLCDHDGRFAYVACNAANEIAVIDLSRLELSGYITTGKQPDGMTWLYKREGYNNPEASLWH